MNHKNKKYYLGLDLGISSVGWAVMTKEEEEYYIDDFGVRLFDCAENPKDGTTNAEERRKFRSVRRLNRRRKQRINELKWFLEKNNIISKVEVENFFKIFKITNNIKYDDTKYFNPYVIRVKGLTQKLTPNELAVALINIANHRGYNDKFSFGEENKKSKLNESITKASSIVQQYQTIAQAILNDQNFKNPKNQESLGLIHNKITKIKETNNNSETNEESKNIKSQSNYRYLFDRKDYQKELELILNNQEQYYPQLNEASRNYLIKDIILRQRDFEVGPGPKNKEKYKMWEKNMKQHQLFQPFSETEGTCTFYPQEPRGYRCSLTFELFRFVSDLSTFTVKFLDPEATKKITKIIFNKFKHGKILDRTSIKKIIKENSDINEQDFKSGAWSELTKKINFNYLKLMNEILPNEFKNLDLNNLSNHIFNAIGKILHQNITPERRKNKLNEFFKSQNISLSQEIIEKFLDLPSSISTSTSNASFKYMQEAIVAFFEHGISYGIFQAEFNKAHEANMFNFNLKAKLFQPIDDLDLKKNAVVFRAINQTRKIIKALHDKYYYFEVINVEVARELAKSFDERSKIKKQNDLNFEKRLEIEQELKNNNIRVNGVNVTKYRLWQQQDGKCIYCQDHHDINLSDFDNKNALQLDHIIPQSKIADDSIHNLVLVCARTNQEKTNQTPLQWLTNNNEHEKSYLNFCKEIRKKISDKKYDYLVTKNLNDETVNDFATRNLNDTRYITRYVYNWLKAEFMNWEKNTGEIIETKVQAIVGTVTSRFRRIWLNDSPWGLEEKVRDITPYHHAVDAIILTQFISPSYVSFASDIASVINLKKKLFKGFINQVEYEKICQAILKKWQINKLQFDLGVRLEKLINKKINTFKVMAPLVKNLKEVVETRIPIKLEIIKQETKPKKIKNAEKEVTKLIDIPKYIEVLNQEEYNQKMQLSSLKGDLHYPFISYKINYKLSGAITSSQLPASHYQIKKDKLGRETKIKRIDSESYFKDKSNTLWEINNYYGVVFDEKNNFNPIWIRRINAKKEELNKYQNYNILVPKTIVEYYDKKKNKKVIKLFNAKKGTSIYANLLGTVNIVDENKNKEIFIEQNLRDSISNWKKEFKILRPNILGKILTN